MITVLAQIKPLPGPQRRRAIPHRHQHRRSQQTRLNVRRHIVRPLQRVTIIRLILRHEFIEMRLEIRPHVRTRVLVQRQRRRGMQNKHLQHPRANLRQFRQRLHHLPGHQMKSTGTGPQRRLFLNPLHESTLTTERNPRQFPQPPSHPKGCMTKIVLQF